MNAPMKLLVGLVALFTLTEAHAMRWYSPNTGRWFSRDPAGENGGQNLYSFVGNRPVECVDLFGLVGKGGAQLLRWNPDPRECRSDCPEWSKQVVSIVNRGSPVNQEPALGSLPEWTGGHIDLVIPGCTGSGMVGFYGNQEVNPSKFAGAITGIPGVLNMSFEDWLNPNRPSGGRPPYVQGQRGWVCEIKVCPTDIDEMCKKASELQKDPPSFRMLGNNCSTTACQILNAGNAGPKGGIIGIDNPQALQRQSNSKNCYYGLTTAAQVTSMRYDFYTGNMAPYVFNTVIVVKDPNQDHPARQ